MKICRSFGVDDLAIVYIGETVRGRRLEFAESRQPPVPREEKWVLIISTLYGCPVGCEMCDAGGNYRGRISTYDMLAQLDYMIRRRYPDGRVPVRKFKIQFSRVGEPALNPGVLEVLKQLPSFCDAPGLVPSLSTVAPAGRDDFFEELLRIKDSYYRRNFQLQFSIHTTDEGLRDRIIPVEKWSLEEIAEYGVRIHRPGDRKVTLNFVLIQGYPIDPCVLGSIFSPEVFFIKMTPLNPTFRAEERGLKSLLGPRQLSGDEEPEIIPKLREMGYDVLLSIGELEENKIGSNCGQYIKTFEEYAGRGMYLKDSYRPQPLASGTFRPVPKTHFPPLP